MNIKKPRKAMGIYIREYVLLIVFRGTPVRFLFVPLS